MTPAIYTCAQAETFSQAASRVSQILPVHVKIDTGMSRVGVMPEDSVDFVLLISKLPGLKVRVL